MLLMNEKQEMATIILSLHAKQPKRGTISFEHGYIEIYEYPRGDEAVITYTDDGHTEKITAGATEEALQKPEMNGDSSTRRKKYEKKRQRSYRF